MKSTVSLAESDDVISLSPMIQGVSVSKTIEIHALTNWEVNMKLIGPAGVGLLSLAAPPARPP